MPIKRCGKCGKLSRSVCACYSTTARGYGGRWPAIRAKVLALQPECQVCGATATQVDHIWPKVAGGTDDSWNLRALCGPCHWRKTAQDRKRHKKTAPR